MARPHLTVGAVLAIVILTTCAKGELVVEEVDREVLSGGSGVEEQYIV